MAMANYQLPQLTQTSVRGAPLNRLEIPNVQTLIQQSGRSAVDLSMIDVSDMLRQGGITPQTSVITKDETIGIELNLNLFGASSQVSATPGVQQAQTVGRAIPTNMREARDMLHLISPKRSVKNTAFGIQELKKIAKNLNLPTSGNKDVLAEKIRTAVINYFGLSQ